MWEVSQGYESTAKFSLSAWSFFLRKQIYTQANLCFKQSCSGSYKRNTQDTEDGLGTGHENLEILKIGDCEYRAGLCVCFNNLI